MALKPPEGLPKLSGITSTLATPEIQFENTVKEVAKVELPEGPLSMLTKFQESFESGGSSSPELPELPKIDKILARLPELPKLPELLGGSSEKEAPGYQPAKEEKRTKRGYVPIA